MKHHWISPPTQEVGYVIVVGNGVDILLVLIAALFVDFWWSKILLLWVCSVHFLLAWSIECIKCTLLASFSGISETVMNRVGIGCDFLFRMSYILFLITGFNLNRQDLTINVGRFFAFVSLFY